MIDYADRLPPQDLAAEAGVLGSMLLDNACTPTVANQLDADAFYSPDHKAVFEAIMALHADGTPADLLLLSDALRARGDLERVGGNVFLVSLLAGTPSSANAEYYAYLVRNAAVRRTLIAIGSRLAVLGYDATATVEAMVEQLDEGVTEAKRLLWSGAGEYDLAEAVGRARAELLGEDGAWRWKTLVPAIDSHFGGMRVGKVWVLGGRSGHMKTALAMNVGWQTMLAGFRVAMFRWEESEQSMLLRLASLDSGAPYGDMTGDEVRDVDVLAFDGALQSQPERYGSLLRIHFAQSFGQIAAIIGAWKPALVIYDTLQAWADREAKGSDQRRDLQVQRCCQFAAELCASPETQHAAILISQLQKGDGVPTMKNLRESGAIEEAADAVLLLYWPHKDDADKHEGYVLLKVGKNRVTGRLGNIVATVDVGTQRFRDCLSREEANAFVRSL